LASCSGAPGTKVTVQTENPFGQPDPILAVAYQVGDGPWQRAWPDEHGVYGFELPPGESRYGVTVRCGGFLDAGLFSSAATYLLTTADTTEPRLACPTMGAFAELEGDVDASALGAQGVRVAGGTDEDSYGLGGTFNYGLMVPEGEVDLVVLAYNAHTLIPSNLIGGRVFRNVGAVGQAGYDTVLAAGDTVSHHLVQAFAVPAGWSGGYKVNFVTAGGTVLFEGQLGRGSSTGGAYVLPAGTVEGDTLVLSVDASDGANRSVGLLRYVSAAQATDLAPTLDLEPFPPGYSVAAARFPTFALNHPASDLDGYFVFVFWPYTLWSYQISPAWIEDRSALTLPDLTGLVGFEAMAPQPGEHVDWVFAALRADMSAEELFGGARYFVDGYVGLPFKPGRTLENATIRGGFDVP
jgi:hypothetical protein